MSTLDVARITGTSLAMIEKHYGHLKAKRTRGIVSIGPRRSMASDHAVEHWLREQGAPLMMHSRRIVHGPSPRSRSARAFTLEHQKACAKIMRHSVVLPPHWKGIQG